MFDFIEFAGIFKNFPSFAAYFYTHFLSWRKITNARKNVWATNLQNLNFLTNGLRYHLDLFHAMSWYVWATFVFHKQYSISYWFVRKMVEKFVNFLLGIMVWYTDKKILPRVKIEIRSYLIKKKVTTYFDVIE